jgi:GDPmannose 4,6-dehydratase
MRALICGVGGQDGAYLAASLLRNEYEVFGTSRDAATATFENLRELKIRDSVKTLSMVATDFRSVLTALKLHSPDEVYNLSGQSSVGLSFEQPVETIESIVIGTLNLLEAIRFMDRPIRFYNAGSGECFGDTNGVAATEDTPFRPRSPYAVAKASAHELVVNYRESYGLFCCNGILFNHESPLRPERFVTQKIVRTAARLRDNPRERLRLGNMDVERDWGWAPEYVEAMRLMMRAQKPDDYVIATGRSVSLRYFAERVFAEFSLPLRDLLEEDSSMRRPSDVRTSRADPGKAKHALTWKATVEVDGVVERMCAPWKNR